MRISVHALLFAALCVPGSLPATEYRVAPGASLTDAAGRLKAGDVLTLAPGEYRQSMVLGGVRGTAGAPVTIRGKGALIVPRERDGILVTEKSAHLVIVGLRIEGAARGGIVIGDSSHIVVRECSIGGSGLWGIQTCLSEDVVVEDCELRGSLKQHGIYFSTTDRPAVRRCRIHGNAACGIHLNGDRSEGGDGVISGGVIEDNLIWENGRSGGAAINMDGVEGTAIRSNLIALNHAGGIASFHIDGEAGRGSNTIENNTVYFLPGEGRYAVQLLDVRGPTLLRRNILVSGKGPVLEVDPESLRGLRSDANVSFSSSGQASYKVGDESLDFAGWQTRAGDRASLQEDPRLVNPAAGDLRLSADSPAKRLGAGVRAPASIGAGKAP